MSKIVCRLDKNTRDVISSYFETRKVLGVTEEVYFNSIIQRLAKSISSKGSSSGNGHGIGEEDGDELKIVFVGVYNSGKSSHVNNFLRKKLCPVCDEVCTKFPWEIVFKGKKKEFTYYFEGKQTLKRELNDDDSDDSDSDDDFVDDTPVSSTKKLSDLPMSKQLKRSLLSIRDLCKHVRGSLNQVDINTLSLKEDENEKDELCRVFEEGEKEKKVKIGRIKKFIEERGGIDTVSDNYDDPKLIQMIYKHGYPKKCVLQYPFPKYRGISIVDLAGLGEDDVIDETVYSYCKRAFIIIYHINALTLGDHGVSEKIEKAVLTKLQEKVGHYEFLQKTFFLVTHMDKVKARGLINQKKVTTKAYHASRIRLVEKHLKSFLGSTEKESDDPSPRSPRKLSQDTQEEEDNIINRVFAVSFHEKYFDPTKWKKKKKMNQLEYYIRLYRRFVKSLNLYFLKYYKYLLTTSMKQISSALTRQLRERNKDVELKTEEELKMQSIIKKLQRVFVQLSSFINKDFKENLGKGIKKEITFDSVVDQVCVDKIDFEESDYMTFKKNAKTQIVLRITSIIKSRLRAEELLDFVKIKMMKLLKENLKEEEVEFLREVVHVDIDFSKNDIDFSVSPSFISKMIKGTVASTLGSLGGAALVSFLAGPLTGLVVLGVLGIASNIASVVFGVKKHEKDILEFRKKEFSFDRKWREGALKKILEKVKRGFQDNFVLNLDQYYKKYWESLNKIMSKTDLMSDEKFKECETILYLSELSLHTLFRNHFLKVDWCTRNKKPICIGEGTYGSVFKAILHDKGLMKNETPKFNNTNVAIKVCDMTWGEALEFKFDFTKKSSKAWGSYGKQGNELHPFQDSFIREAHLLLSLNHPNVCFAHSCYFSKKRTSLYLVLPFLGSTLLKHLKLMTLKERLHCAIEIAKGLRYLHDQTLMHRDLKPDNVLITQDRKGVRIIDFGFLKREKRSNATFVGNPAYNDIRINKNKHLLPEKRYKYGVEVDIFSFGLILIDLFEQKPYYKTNAIDKKLWNTGVGAGEENKVGSIQTYFLSDNCAYSTYVPLKLKWSVDNQDIFVGLKMDYSICVRKSDDFKKVYEAIVRDCVNLKFEQRPSAAKVVERLEKMRSDFLPKTKEQSAKHEDLVINIQKGPKSRTRKNKL